jgi:hypothetical protein
LLQALFAEGDSVQLTQDNHELLGDAKIAHRKSLRKDYNRRYFRWNWGFSIPGVLIATLSMIIALQFGASVYVLAVGALMLLMIGAFFALMRAPTIRGRMLLDEMLGFKDYLEVAEKDELNLRNPPEKTPQLRARARRGSAVVRKIRRCAGLGATAGWGRLPSCLVWRGLGQYQHRVDDQHHVQRAEYRDRLVSLATRIHLR